MLPAVTVIHVQASQSERKWQYISSTGEICKKKKKTKNSPKIAWEKTKRQKYIFDRRAPRILDCLLRTVKNNNAKLLTVLIAELLNCVLLLKTFGSKTQYSMFWLLGLFCHNSVYLRERSEEKSHVMGGGGAGVVRSIRNINVQGKSKWKIPDLTLTPPPPTHPSRKTFPVVRP